jgi:hypothetical protein
MLEGNAKIAGQFATKCTVQQDTAFVIAGSIAPNQLEPCLGSSNTQNSAKWPKVCTHSSEKVHNH